MKYEDPINDYDDEFQANYLINDSRLAGNIKRMLLKLLDIAYIQGRADTLNRNIVPRNRFKPNEAHQQAINYILGE